MTKVKARRLTPSKHHPGDVFGDLVLMAYSGRSAGGDTLALFACQCGTVTEKHLRNAVAGLTTRCTDRSKHPHPTAKAIVSYSGAHQRLRERFGSASTHPCARCQKVGAGNQWTYRHGAENVHRDATGKDAGKAYSHNPRDYFVLCRSCHMHFDKAHARLNLPPGAVSLPHLVFAYAYQPIEEIADL